MAWVKIYRMDVMHEIYNRYINTLILFTYVTVLGIEFNEGYILVSTIIFFSKSLG